MAEYVVFQESNVVPPLLMGRDSRCALRGVVVIQLVRQMKNVACGQAAIIVVPTKTIFVVEVRAVLLESDVAVIVIGIAQRVVM